MHFVKIDTIFISSGNSKTSDRHKLMVSFVDKERLKKALISMLHCQNSSC